jgi:hypothetical protein
MQTLNVEHRSKIECYPSFKIAFKFKNLRDYIESRVYIRVSAMQALGFEI